MTEFQAMTLVVASIMTASGVWFIAITVAMIDARLKWLVEIRSLDTDTKDTAK